MTAAYTPTIEALRAQLEFEVDARRKLSHVLPGARFMGNADLLLKHGTAYRKAPERPCGGLPKMCFSNCYRVANRSRGEWIYCEGYALPDTSPLAVHHAWLVRADDPTVAYDPTWAWGAVYFGIPFRVEYMRKCARASKTEFCVLDNWRQCYPLLTGTVKIEDVIWRPAK